MVSVYLSPSTQQDNIGVGSYGTEENRMNEIANYTERELKRHGVTVYRNNPNMTLQQIVKDSNEKKPNIHFALHSNSGGGHGCEVFCYRFGSVGETLAKSIYNALSMITPSNDRGVKQGYNFYGSGKHMYEVAYTNAPAVLVEVDFHDSLEGVNWILQNIERIGLLYAYCLLNHLGIKYIPQTTSNINTSKNYKSYDTILGEVSKYKNTWIKFIGEHPEVNIKGLIENIYQFYSK
jgi:N-acetylmuramoyl-L-alanine amidase